MGNQPQLEKWLQVPVGRRTFVTYADLAGALAAAVDADGPPFGAYTIVSDTPQNNSDLSKFAEIAWKPRDFVEEDGSITPARIKNIQATALLAFTTVVAYSFTDVMTQHWARNWGVGYFIPITFVLVAILSFTLMPLFSQPLRQILINGWK